MALGLLKSWSWSGKVSVVNVPEKEATVAVMEPKVPALTMQDLTKMEVKLCEDEVLLSLAEKAKSVLGYGLLESETKQPLLRALLAIDIVPLDQQRVDAYKQQAQSEMREKNLGTGSFWWGWTPLDSFTQKKERVRNGWNDSPKKQYSSPVPEFVLSKAIQIREAIPECEMYIEEMQYYADPFLVVLLEQESYTVEVWDEPKFEGRISK